MREWCAAGGRVVSEAISMEQIVEHLIRYGLLVVFANVFLEQIGAPITALPTLIMAGALVFRGRMDLAPLVTAALAASLLAEVGRRCPGADIAGVLVMPMAKKRSRAHSRDDG